MCSSLLKTSVLRTRVQAHQGETRSDLHRPRMLAGPRSVSISDAVEALSAACKEQLALGLAQVGGPRGESLKERGHSHDLIAGRIARIRVAHRTVDVPVPGRYALRTRAEDTTSASASAPTSASTLRTRPTPPHPRATRCYPCRARVVLCSAIWPQESLLPPPPHPP